MYDYNFFESYKIKKKLTQQGTGLMLAGFLISVVILGGFSAYTYYVNAELNNEVQALQEELNKPSNIALVQRINDKQEMLTNLTGVASSLQIADAALMLIEPINADLVNTIVLALPSDAQISSMSLNQESVSMNGMAAQRSAIAEFEKTLRESELVQDVYVSNISSTTTEGTDDIEYTFNLNIEIGGVMNENNN